MVKIFIFCQDQCNSQEYVYIGMSYFGDVMVDSSLIFHLFYFFILLFYLFYSFIFVIAQKFKMCFKLPQNEIVCLDQTLFSPKLV